MPGKTYSNFYVFDSRIATHVLFWALYYALFGYIWAKNGEYLASYFLEFILLPIRIMAVYLTIYWQIPRYLLAVKLPQFLAFYLLLMLISGTLQHLFIFFFYEPIFGGNAITLFDLSSLLRAVILINSTVLFVSSIKIAQLFIQQKERFHDLENRPESGSGIEIKAEKRVHRVDANDILYIEGLGNYVAFVMHDQKIISYISLKEALKILPGTFVRVHKSFIVNKSHVKSYNSEDVEIGEKYIPIGRSYRDTATL